MKAKRQPRGEYKHYRSSKTGRFVSWEYARRHKATTQGYGKR